MTFEEFNRALTPLNAELFMLRRTSPHDPRLLPDMKRDILMHGEWCLHIISTRNKLGRSDGRSVTVRAHTVEKAFDIALEAWLNPYVYTPRPKPQAIELDLDLGDLDL